MKGCIKIPKLQINVEAVANLAEMRNLYVIDAKQRGMVYIYADGEIVVCTTRGGYLRLRKDAAAEFIQELSEILTDLDDLKRMKVQA